MALLLCQVCNGKFDGQVTENFVCKKCEHVADAFFAIQDRLHDAEWRAQCIQNDVMGLLREHHASFIHNENKIAVSSKLLEELWDAAQCRQFKTTTAKAFCHEYGLMLRVLMSAVRLFQSNLKYEWNTPEEKFEKLHHACVAYYNSQKWPLNELANDSEIAIQRVQLKKKGWFWWK